jgi:hypothetical protein
MVAEKPSIAESIAQVKKNSNSNNIKIELIK